MAKLLSLVALMLALAGTPFSALAEGGGEEGVGGADGDALRGRVEGDDGRGRTRTVARQRPLCTLLRDSAATPGQEVKQGKLKFKAHTRWVADLICDFMDRAAGEEPLFKRYQVRRAYMVSVLDALQRHGGVSTAHIDRAQLRVGDRLHWITFVRKQGKVLSWKDKPVKSMWVVRSYERPAMLLAGMKTPLFLIKDKKKRTKPIEWIKKGESFILRVFALAALGEMVLADGVDVPLKDMGKRLETLTRAFQGRAHLANTSAKPFFKELGAGTRSSSDDPPPRRPAGGGGALGDTSVDLQWNGRPQVPVAGAPGMSLFEYRPLRGAVRRREKNIRAWFITSVAGAGAGGEAEGIALPSWTMELRKRSSAIPEALIDEMTRADVETRFEVWAGLVVRIYVYAQPAGSPVTTVDILRHERAHAEGIRTAWAARTTALGPAFQALAGRLNAKLGLAGDEAFRAEHEEIRGTWRLRRKPANKLEWHAAAVPRGRLAKRQNAAVLHTNPQVSYLRFRLTRRTRTDKPVIDLITNKKPLDPKFAQADKEWRDWKNNQWHRYKNGFVRAMLIAGLRLDIREGAIGPDGRRAGRPELVRVLRKFMKATDPTNKKAAKRNPLTVMRKLRR